nr:RNA polymerase beta subunit protein a [Follicularia botryoides]
MPTFRHYVPDLVEIQRQSFFYFLEKGMIEEFSKRNPITNVKKDIEIYFYPEYYGLTKPKYSIQQAILKNRSYSSKLYVPVQLTDKKRKRLYLKWMLIAHLPLMTKRGHFLLNGAARVIVNQIVRSPGVYFQEKLHEVYMNKWNEKPDFILKRYYADLICLRGTWLRIEIDKEKLIWAQMKKGPKIPILWLLIAMGFSQRVIFSSLESAERLLENFKPKEKVSKNQKDYAYVQHPPQAWKQLYELMHSTKGRRIIKNPSELGRRWLFKKFMNPRTYDLGKHGRIAINQKLGLTLCTNQNTLTAQDLLAITDYLLKVEKGFYKTDDIDHLKNRRLRTSGDLLQTQFSIGLIRLEKFIRDKLSQTTNFRLENLINSRPVNGALKEFFGTNPLSQFMDQINPLAEITHKRRLSSMGPGGVTRDNATLAIRGIHPSHYGRICPIETPEGKNTGLVNSLTTYGRIDSQGLIQSPFFKVYKGQVQKHLGMIYLTADQEERMKVAAADVYVSKTGFLTSQTLPARIGKDFITIHRSEVDFIGISAIQMISVATSLIPFLEHDDANRALMGSNMQRQAVPLIRPEKPLVGTGLEARAASDSGHVLTSKCAGYVTYSSGSKIIVYAFKSKL